MRSTAWGLGLVASLALGGCDDTGNPFLVTSGTGGQLVIAVTGGVTPTYSWDGPRARVLTVRGAGGVLWQIEATDEVGFVAPVQHGIAPAGARTVVAAQILEAGTVHTVTITTVTGTQGSRSFTPAAPSTS